MKRMAFAVGAMALAMSASATLLSDFQFNDGVGTTLPQAAQGVAGAGTWNYDTGGTAADGSGNMVFSDADNFYPSAPFTAPANSGVLLFSVKFSAADIPTASGELTFTVKESGGNNTLGYVQLRDHNGDTVVVFGEGWSSGSAWLESGSTSLAAPLTVWADIDLDNNQTTYHYEYKGTTHDMATASSIADVAPDQLGAVWQFMDSGGNSISVDYVTVETVPEPASFALMGILGGALLFVRRRFIR